MIIFLQIPPAADGLFNISDIYNLIKIIWTWVYNSLIHLRFRIGDFRFSLFGYAIGVLILSIIFGVSFNLLRTRSVSNISSFGRIASSSAEKLKDNFKKGSGK